MDSSSKVTLYDFWLSHSNCISRVTLFRATTATKIRAFLVVNDATQWLVLVMFESVLDD